MSHDCGASLVEPPIVEEESGAPPQLPFVRIASSLLSLSVAPVLNSPGGPSLLTLALSRSTGSRGQENSAAVWRSQLPTKTSLWCQHHGRRGCPCGKTRWPAEFGGRAPPVQLLAQPNGRG